MTAISFKVTRQEDRLIQRIVKRVEKSRPWLTRAERALARQSLAMDLTACHANGTPLRLADLLAADEFNFWHDVNGIEAHMDRTTGQLDGRFLPRFAVPVIDLMVALKTSLATEAQR